MAKSKRHDVDMAKRGAYLERKHGRTARAGAHKNRKREVSRKACRKSFSR